LILAAGLTPAWQQMLVFDGLRVGEVNRAREALWCASGKVLNVGIALHHLGGPSRTIALVGGLPGDEIERELGALGVPATFTRSRRPTRACTTILDRASGETTELVENAGAVEPDEIRAFQDAYARAASSARMAVLSGSLPPGAGAGFYRDLMDASRCRVVLDARGPELREALARGPFAVKPNREELGKTVGRELRSDEDLEAAIGEMHRLGAEWVIVSEGKKALWASGGGRTRRFRPSEVPTVNPIGCGDCLAAGFAWAVDQGMDPWDAVRFGMGAAAENASMLLPSRLDPARVRARMEEVREIP
jgi:1-phosphofructokinase family hexose kinase